MLDILKSLYAINGLAAILFYVPQIRNAWKNQSPMCSVSLVTFGGGASAEPLPCCMHGFLLTMPCSPQPALAA